MPSMLRKLSHRITRAVRGEAFEQEPDFACVDARRLEAQASATKPRRSWELGDENSFYVNRQLEALHLEPIIAPTLKRMGPTVAAREALAPPPGHLDLYTPLPDMPFAHLKQPLAARQTDEVILSHPVPGISEQASGKTANPYDGLDTINELQVTSYPVRPILRRQAVSYRTHRDLPLRVQAVRRAHQEEFSRKLAKLQPVPHRPRRGSDPGQSELPRAAPESTKVVPPQAQNVRPLRPLVPEAALRRARSEAQMGMGPQRAASRAKRAAQQDDLPQPLRPHAPKRTNSQAARDFYIESAQELWQLPKSRRT